MLKATCRGLVVRCEAGQGFREFGDVGLRVGIAFAEGVQLQQFTGIVLVGQGAPVEVAVQVDEHGGGEAHIVHHPLEITSEMALDHADVAPRILRHVAVVEDLRGEMAVPEQGEAAV